MDNNNKQSRGRELIIPGPPHHERRTISNMMMEQHPRDKNVREDNHEHPSREGRKTEVHLQETSHQLLNEDGTITNWDEGIDPRIIRDCYELFIHEDCPDVDLEEKFEDMLMRIHGSGFKRRIITDQAEWKNIILRSKCRRG